MSDWKFQRALVGLALLMLAGVSCNSAIDPAAIPHTATPDIGPEDDPTAGAIVRITRQARATLEGQATATRQAQLDAAATQVAVEAAQTAEAQAVATATIFVQATAQAIVAEKTDWPARIHEAFTDNQLGWPIGLKQDHSLAVTSTIEAGGYHWLVKVVNGNSYFNLVPAHSPAFADFAAAVNVKFGHGNDDGQSAYGLTFRHVDDDYGFFGILKSGAFLALEVHHTGIYQSIGGSSLAIDARPGHTNRLVVVGIGSNFVFLINGQQVGMLTAEIEPGQIGLGVDSARRASEAQVEFSDFEIHAP